MLTIAWKKEQSDEKSDDPQDGGGAHGGDTNGTTTQVAAIVKYNATTRTATLNPDTNLRLGATYIATVTTVAM